VTLQKAYELAGVNEPLALYTAYSKLEQVLFKNRTWDYDNPDQTHNQIKREVEEINLDSLNEDEALWCREIMWYWHHHAISAAAIWKRDKTMARIFATKALEHQTADHPNKITRLLYFLVHSEFEKAEEWAKTITCEDGPVAQDVIGWYRDDELFRPSS